MILWLCCFFVWNISFAQNVQRNLFIETMTSDQLIFTMNDSYYYPLEETNEWYKEIITLPKISLQQSDTKQSYIFKVIKDWKLYYVWVNIEFNSFEELNNKNKIFLYVWNKKPQEKENYTILENNWIFIQSSENVTYKIQEKWDISADIIFPSNNILWVKSFWPIAWLWAIVFILVFSYLIWKKQIIRI